MNEKYWIEHEEKENLLREKSKVRRIYSKSIFLRIINILIKIVIMGVLIYFLWMFPSIFLYIIFQSFNYILDSEYTLFFDVLLKLSYPTVNIIFVLIIFFALSITEISTKENRSK